jgi:hypothetical protein
MISSTGKCTKILKQRWGQSSRVDRHRCIAGRCLYQTIPEKIKPASEVTKTKTAIKRETSYRRV